ncbi:hypothetical protein CEXT_469731 [Caerostris extrusa]|uniref:Uncharacterized protein n=1 Tax=Caerostris extrusa TaxID=172846 RepID=A0AAV4TMV6_CAEEX|nr:hypothetical protein CEXT_469731 [Caerostris extrusa]
MTSNHFYDFRGNSISWAHCLRREQVGRMIHSRGGSVSSLHTALILEFSHRRHIWRSWRAESLLPKSFANHFPTRSSAKTLRQCVTDRYSRILCRRDSLIVIVWSVRVFREEKEVFEVS